MLERFRLEGRPALWARHETRVPAVAADLSRLDDRVRLIAAAADRVDVLVNNATGGGRLEHGLATTPEQWRDALEVNVTAPFELCRAVVPGMQARGRGAIVNVLSTPACVVVPPMLADAAMTSARWTTTRHLAREYAPAGASWCGDGRSVVSSRRAVAAERTCPWPVQMSIDA